MPSDLYLEPPLSLVTVGDEQRIAVRQAGGGDGTPLVLLHGIGSNSSAWAGQFAGFAPTRRVIAWNAPGYPGSTPLPAPSPTAGDYGTRVIALLDALDIERAVLVGQSLGAIMGTAAVLLQPERFACAVLASPASGYATPEGAPIPASVAERLDEVARTGPAGLAERRAPRLLTERASPEARAIIHRVMSEVTVEGYAQASRMLAHADLTSDVARLRIPTLVMWGDEDIVTPPAGCARIAAAVPGGQYRVIPRVGHGFATEAPALFNAALADFLSQIED